MDLHAEITQALTGVPAGLPSLLPLQEGVFTVAGCFDREIARDAQDLERHETEDVYDVYAVFSYWDADSMQSAWRAAQTYYEHLSHDPMLVTLHLGVSLRSTDHTIR